MQVMGGRPRIAVLLSVTVVVLVAALVAPSMPQPLSYHDFADCRSWLSIPNTLNVLSNIPFFVFGALGLLAIWRQKPAWHDAEEALPYLVFFLGAILTCIGSMYYHWRPNNPRLVWDRLPMTLAFSGLIAAVVSERIDAAWGRRMLWPLMALGGISVFYWYATEIAGHGNVVPYGAFQAWAVVLLLLVLALYPSGRYSEPALFWWPVLLYGLAKVCEALDLWIYRATGTLASGHTIKHLLAAGAVYAVLAIIARRRPLPATDNANQAAQA